VDRRVVLVALWAVFAAAAVGVGFGAAGLVDDPFTDVGTTTAGPAGTAPPSSAGTRSGGASSPRATASSSPRRSGATAVTRSQTTRGGLVTGTCQDGLVRLSAAPAIGWEIDDLDSGARTEARARFEQVDDGDGKVEVRATCARGRPVFVVRDDSSGGPGGSGSDGSGSSGFGSSGSDD
jgi:hypothetical protein